METEKRTFFTPKGEYEEVELLKKSERSSVFVVRKKENGKRFLLKVIKEKTEVFKKIRGVSCKNLPEIEDVFEDGEQTVVVEEYIPGETVLRFCVTEFFRKKRRENTQDKSAKHFLCSMSTE